MSERVEIRGHQLAAVLGGARGYDEVQEKVLRKLRGTLRSKFVLTAKPGIICGNCPLNPEAPNFSDGEICDPNDSDLVERDLEVINSTT